MLILLLAMSGVFSPVTSRPATSGPVTAGDDQLDSPQAGTQQELQRPRDFHFAVTWFTLFVQLDLIEASGPWQPAAARAAEAPTLALVPVPAPAPWMAIPDLDSSAAWEMVVPRMIRTGPKTFTRVEDFENPELL
jgi:hypothetical protein